MLTPKTSLGSLGGVHTLVGVFSIALTRLRALSIMDVHISAHVHPQSVVSSDQSMKMRSRSAQHQKVHLHQETNIAFWDTGRSYHVPTLQSRALQIPGTPGPNSSRMSPNRHSQGLTLDYSNKHISGTLSSHCWWEGQHMERNEFLTNIRKAPI